MLGTKYETDLIVKTLENVNLECDVKNTTLTVQPPYWRTDLHIKEDVIEEVGRLLGFDNIPLDLPTRPFVGAEEDPLLKLKARIRNILSDRLGAHEVLTYSFVSRDLLEKAGEDPDDAYEIVNSISPDLQRFRTSLIPSLLEKVQENLKAGYKDFSLYEINQTTRKSAGLNAEKVPEMSTMLAFVTLGDFYQAKSCLHELLRELDVEGDAIRRLSERACATTGAPRASEPRDGGRERSVSEERASGCVACIKAGTRKKFKIDQPISYFEINLEKLLRQLPTTSTKHLRLSRFPSTSRDLTIKVNQEQKFAVTAETLEDELAKTELIYRIEPLSIYEPEENPEKTKNLSFRLTLTSPEKTLNGDEISAIMEKVSKKICEVTGGVII